MYDVIRKDFNYCSIHVAVNGSIKDKINQKSAKVDFIRNVLNSTKKDSSGGGT